MMKRINLIELLVLVVFIDLSAAMLSRLGLSSSEEPMLLVYDMVEFCVQPQSQSTAAKKYDERPQIDVKIYDDRTKFEYSLVTKKGEHVFDNTGRNTDIVFLHDANMIIHAKNNANVMYSLEFDDGPKAAKSFANRLVATTPSRYNSCRGSNAYKLKELYDPSRTRSALDWTKDWCIFKDKIRQTNVNTFMIKWVGRPIAENHDPLCAFRSRDFKLERVPNQSKFELTVFWNEEALGPTYILETETPEKLEKFFR